ncbi:hypothetical protein ACFLSQ_07250 [Bacteroidota bacterium]
MKSIIIIIFSIIFLVACSEKTTEPNNNDNNNDHLFSISGTINNTNNINIPESVRLVIAWHVTWNGPDYGYFWTEGDLDLKNNTFKISFDETPPDICFNNGPGFKLGVAIMYLLDNVTIDEGVLDQNNFDPEKDILGYINDSAIIYLSGDYSEIVHRFIGFNEGYNFGKGWYNPGEGFDGWENKGTDGIELIIDSLENIKFPNWT